MKLLKPAIAVLLVGGHFYAGCSDEELDPPRQISTTDGGSSSDGGSTSADGGGSPSTDSGAGNDSGSPQPDGGSGNDSGPKDSGADAKTDGATDAGGDAASDAGQDAGSDASLAAQCATYCGCMAASCVSEEPANCQTTCETQTNWDLACRITHCNLAAAGGDAGATVHCPHAIGVGLCLDN